MNKPTALVTGSTKGIGKAIASLLEKNDYIVIRNGTSKQKYKNYIQADLSNIKGIKKVSHYIKNNYNYLNLLVNNAAFTKYIDYNNPKKLSQKIIDKIFYVNLFAPYHLSMELKKTILNSKKFNKNKPNIINIASVAGINGIGSNIAYAASKGALITLTKSLASSLAPIRVNAISPGLIKTNFVKFPEEYYVNMKKKTPLKIVGEPEDIAIAVNHLILNKYITGQNIVVDGGSSL